MNDSSVVWLAMTFERVLPPLSLTESMLVYYRDQTKSRQLVIMLAVAHSVCKTEMEKGRTSHEEHKLEDQHQSAGAAP